MVRSAESKKEFKTIKNKALRRYAVIINAHNVTGDNIANAANLRYCFDVANNIKDCRYLTNVIDRVEDAYDGHGVASLTTGLEMIDTGDEGARCFFTATVWGAMICGIHIIATVPTIASAAPVCGENRIVFLTSNIRRKNMKD